MYVESGDRNPISNKGINSQCPSINDLLISLATSDRTSLLRLFSVSDQLPVDDGSDGFSGHCWFALVREGGKREKQ